jgi:Flp pilus assembly pilin Flp
MENGKTGMARRKQKAVLQKKIKFNVQGWTEREGIVMLRNWKDLLKDEEGMGTVEIILIIVVLVGLVLIFKEQITKIVNSIFNKITKQTDKV